MAIYGTDAMNTQVTNRLAITELYQGLNFMRKPSLVKLG